MKVRAVATRVSRGSPPETKKEEPAYPSGEGVPKEVRES